MKDVQTDAASGHDDAEEEQWLTTREAASRLEIEPRGLYDLIDRGSLAAFYIEEDLKLRSAEVAAFRGAQPSA